MKNTVNTYDLKTNIVTTIIMTLLAIIVAVISSTIIANGMKSAYANQSFQHQTPVATLTAADDTSKTAADASSCSVPAQERAAAPQTGVLSAVHNVHTKSSHASHTSNHVVNRTTTRNTSQSVSNGNVSNSGIDNDLVDVDDLVDVNVPVNANILNNALNHNSVLNDTIDVTDNNLDLNILSNLL